MKLDVQVRVEYLGDILGGKTDQKYCVKKCFEAHT